MPKKTEKPVAKTEKKPQVIKKAAPKRVKALEVPWAPKLGELSLFTHGEIEFVGSIESFEPLEVRRHDLVNGVHTDEPVDVTLRNWTITELSREEQIKRLY